MIAAAAGRASTPPDPPATRLLATGGMGFIGSHFVRYALRTRPHWTVLNLDKLTYAGNPANLADVEAAYGGTRYRFVRGDIADAGLVARLISEGIDVVLNFAAESHVDRSILDASPFLQTNVAGVGVLLEAARRMDVRRFVQVSCFDEQTRAFTRDGLKHHSELVPGDEVLSLHHETGKIAWAPIQKVIIQAYEGEMIEVKGRRVDLLVTPNHRMLTEGNRSGRVRVMDASALASWSMVRLPRGYWRGVDPGLSLAGRPVFDVDLFYVIGLFIGDGFLGYQERKRYSRSGLSRAEYLRLGRDRETGRFTVVAERGTREQVVMRSHRIFFDVPEADPCRPRLEEALRRLGETPHGQRGKAGEHVYVTSQSLSAILETCGKHARNKRIPQWAMEAPREALEALFEGLVDSDGTWRRGGGAVFHTVSTGLVNDVIEICAKLGFGSTVGRRHTEGQINGRHIVGDAWWVSISKTRRFYLRRQMRRVSYRGNVWCAVVPEAKTLLVERNGRCVFSGNTDEVYGPTPERTVFDEDAALRPSSPYAASKAAADLLCLAFHRTYGVPVIIGRCTNNYGPYQYPEKFIPLIITHALEDEPIPLYGDGQQVRDWLYVEDHCEVLCRLVEAGVPGEIYNVAGVRSPTNYDLAARLLGLLGRPLSLLRSVADRPAHDRCYALDDSKVRTGLGFIPRWSFEAGLVATVEWYREHPEWWRPLKHGEFRTFFDAWYSPR